MATSRTQKFGKKGTKINIGGPSGLRGPKWLQKMKQDVGLELDERIKKYKELQKIAILWKSGN